jgi:hypothetical protein
MTETNRTPEIGQDVAAHEKAIRRAVREAVLTHARLGRSVVGWVDGRLVRLTPEQVIAASVSWREENT